MGADCAVALFVAVVPLGFADTALVHPTGAVVVHPVTEFNRCW